MIIIKKYFKYIGLIGICLLSFYYTEQVALYIKDKNPIMKSIKDISSTKYVNSINCSIIEDIYIIPGYNGKEVNEEASFSNMKTTEYNENLLVFSEVKPNISLEDNKDKIIIRGNHKKNAVSLLFENNNYLSKYVIQKKYKVNLLIEKEIYDKDYELINNSNDKNTYKKIERYLNKNSMNKELCYTTTKSIPSLCNNKYTFTHSLEINHSNISTQINTITSGDIILIKDSLSLSELDIILNQISYKDLNIVPISTLISESNKLEK